MSTTSADTQVLPTIQIKGDVKGSIVFGDNNFVVNSNHGTIVYRAALPRVSRISARPIPPRPPIIFLDRSEEVQRSSQILAGYQPVAVVGEKGIGKTTLLKQIANSFPPEQFPDGIVFIDGEWGAISASGLDGVVQSVFESLFESDPPLKVNLLTARSYMSEIKSLIVFDHLNLPSESWQKLPDLFPSGGLIWTAENPISIQNSWEIRLSRLPPDDAVQLFLRTSGMGELGQDADNNLRQICAKLNHQPMAIVTLGRLVQREQLSIAEAFEIVSSLSASGNNSSEISLAAIVVRLDEPAKRIASLVASIDGPKIDRGILVRASSMEPGLAESSLDNLQQVGLVQTDNQDVWMHPVHVEIIRRMLPVSAAQRSRLAEAVLNFHTGQPFSLDLMRGQLGNLLGALNYGLQSGRAEIITIAAKFVVPLLVLSGKWELWYEIFQRISHAAQLSNDNALFGRALHELGTYHLATGNQAEAVRLLTQARDIRLQNGDLVGAEYSQHNLNYLLGSAPPDQTSGSHSHEASLTNSTKLGLGKFLGFFLVALVALASGMFLLMLVFAKPPNESGPISEVTKEEGNLPIPVTGESFTPTPTNTPPNPITATYSPTTPPTRSATITPSLTLTPTPTWTSTPTDTPTPTETSYPEPFGVIFFGSNRGVDGNQNIYQMQADGRRISPVTNLSGNNNRPDLPKDGSQIAFIHGPSGQRDILYTTDQGELIWVPRSATADESNPSWNADGTWFAYQTNENGDFEIAKYNVKNGVSTPLTENNFRDACPDWSPKGNWIAFESNRTGDLEVFIMNSDNTIKKNLTKNPARDRCPVWSPDESMIAFLSDRSGRDELYVMNSDGSNQHPITDQQGIIGDASWSPDGNWLAYMVDINGNADIFIISLDRKIIRNLTNGSFNDTYPVWVDLNQINFTINKLPLPSVD